MPCGTYIYIYSFTHQYIFDKAVLLKKNSTICTSQGMLWKLDEYTTQTQLQMISVTDIAQPTFSSFFRFGL